MFELLKKVLGFSILFIFIFLFATPLNAGLDDFHYRILKAAFVNGYIRALKLDLEKIKFVKNNRKEMKKYVKLEADNYMKEVTKLNVEKYNDKETKISTETYKSMRWW